MFARQFRLPPVIFSQKPQTVTTPLFQLRFAPNNRTYNRYGIIISKKIDKRSVARNRMKRLLRTFLQSFHPGLRQGYDMLFFIRKPFVEDSGDVQTVLREVLAQEKFL